MECVINEKLVGCRVVIKTRTDEIEGNVHRVVPGSKISIRNAKALSSQTELPSLFHLFLKDIVSSKNL